MAEIPERFLMTSYRGSLRIIATHDVVDAVFNIADERLEVMTGDERLGIWALTDLSLEDTGTQVKLVLDGESVVVDVANHDSFVAAITPTPVKKRRGKRAKKPEGPDRVRQPEPAARAKRPDRSRRSKPQKHERSRSRLEWLDLLRKLSSRDTWREWLSQRVVKWSVASFAVIGVAALALFATNSLGMILILLGMVALVVAALSVSEDLTAFGWIPGNLSETTLIIAGVIAMAIGGLLIVIG